LDGSLLVNEESMPRDSAHAPQLPLFVHDIVGYPDALTRYEAIRPVLKGEQSLRQQSQQTGMNYWRLWRERPSITTRIPVQVMMEVFQLLDNNPLLGHYRVKMALDSLGYRYGHTTVWQMVALYKQAHLPAPRQKYLPNPDERPQHATAPHQVWCIDVRYLAKIEGHWLYSILLFDSYSRSLVGAGCFHRQNLSRVVQVCRRAIAQWGAPDTIVSDNAGVFLALSPCLQQLGIHWTPIVRGHPWQNLAEGGFSIQRRMLDAYVVGGTTREVVYRQHAQFVQDYPVLGALGA
jgi:transposase InsO family protein